MNVQAFTGLTLFPIELTVL